ncbi:MAG: secondary thiamine-phosphate synthase enzyme YjbQ [Bacteroidota bacterium]|nr:secondary thiamine-phosphate synthase enzyme YjbQ [Bacteroidota bacterium]MDP4204688.1 secondary thiamine-phosphate synthase enzyme YjbQ [Bacteroidota bacterium]
MILQRSITLPAFRRGYHLITDIIEKEAGSLPEKGLMNVFIKHTSAALTLNENADPTVRYDFEKSMNRMIPENDSLYTHDEEGADDMPAHLKASLLGASLTIPISGHRLNLGTWQGIYLCEFRNYGGARKIVLTIYS